MTAENKRFDIEIRFCALVTWSAAIRWTRYVDSSTSVSWSKHSDHRVLRAKTNGRVRRQQQLQIQFSGYRGVIFHVAYRESVNDFHDGVYRALGVRQSWHYYRRKRHILWISHVQRPQYLHQLDDQVLISVRLRARMSL